VAHNGPSGLIGIFSEAWSFQMGRVLRPANAIERDAGFGLAAMASDLEPTEAAIKALPDRR
jgi:hypothetical protein